MINREIVEQIVIEVLKRLESSSLYDKPKLLVVNPEEGPIMKKLEKQWTIIKQSSNVNEIPTDVLFCNVNQDLLVKAALGMTDTIESELFSHVIMRGCRVTFILSEQLEWLLNKEINETVNIEYVNHILKYKEKIESFGVCLKLEPTLSLDIYPMVNVGKDSSKLDSLSFQGKLLTQRDVQNHKQEKIMIEKTTIVTPLARDLARELGKRIIYVTD